MRQILGKRHGQIFALAAMTLINHSMTFSTSFAISEMLYNANSTNPNPHAGTVHWTTSQTSYVQTAYLIGMAIFILPSGFFSNFLSNGKMLGTGILFTGVFHAVIPLFANFSWLAVSCSRFYMGAFGAAVSPCCANLLSRWAPVEERSRMSSFMTTSSALGNVLGAFFSGFLAVWVGWPSIFYFFGILNVALGLLLIWVLCDSPMVHPSISDDEKSLYVRVEDADCQRMQKLPSPPWRAMLTSVPVWAIIVAQCGVNWGTNTIAAEIPLYMKNILHYQIVKTTMLYAIPYILLWCIGFPFSWTSDFAIRRGWPIATMRKIFNTVGTCGPALFLIVIACLGAEQKIWTVVALNAAIVLKAGTHCGFFVSAIDISPNYAGPLTSVIVVVGTLVGSLAPLAWGRIVEDMNDIEQWRRVFWLAAGILFCANLFYAIFARGTVQEWDNPRSSRVSRREETIGVDGVLVEEQNE